MTLKADAVRAVSQQFRDRMNAVIEGVMAHLRDDNAKEILGPGLSSLIGRGSLRGIVTLALYADVLRVVRDMTVTDGSVSDEEINEGSDLLSALAEAFAKTRAKDYASFGVLTSGNVRPFLKYYEDDTGFFGHANQATRWAGINICRNIGGKYKDSRPLSLFGAALSEWAQVIAASDGISQSEQSHLQSLASFLNVPHNPGHSRKKASQPTTSPAATAVASPLISGDVAVANESSRLRDWVVVFAVGFPVVVLGLCFAGWLMLSDSRVRAIRQLEATNQQLQGQAATLQSRLTDLSKQVALQQDELTRLKESEIRLVEEKKLAQSSPFRRKMTQPDEQATRPAEAPSEPRRRPQASIAYATGDIVWFHRKCTKCGDVAEGKDNVPRNHWEETQKHRTYECTAPLLGNPGKTCGGLVTCQLTTPPG